MEGITLAILVRTAVGLICCIGAVIGIDRGLNLLNKKSFKKAGARHHESNIQIHELGRDN